jgi:tRNA (guanosine-2'-O-)-methyltransferase
MTPERFQTLIAALNRRQPDLTVLTDNVHKPHNIAALMRTCDAVGVLGIHVVGGDRQFKRPRGISGGTAPWLEVHPHDDVTKAGKSLKDSGFQIVAAHFSSGAHDYREVDYTRPTALLLGAELRGVSPAAAALADVHAVLPMRGLVSSLNVSVAAALFLYEAARQREAAGMYGSSRLAPTEFHRVLFEWCHPDVARRCLERGVPYPRLTADGDLAENPFQPGGSSAPGRLP